MKKTIFYVVTLLTILSCSKEDDPTPTKEPFYLAPDAMIYISPAAGVTLKKGSTEHLSALEIVKQCAGIYLRNEALFGDQDVIYGFSDVQRDTVSATPKLMRWATDLLNNAPEGGYYLTTEFIDANDIVYLRLLDPNNVEGGYDTIAYTPNATVKQMAIDIRKALADGDTLKAYNTFNEKMTFTPITGAEWRALKDQNLQ